MNDTSQTRAELLKAAIAAHQSGRPDETRKACERLLAFDPEDENALHLTGLAWQAQRQFARSLSFLERARTANPNNPFIHYNLGVTMQGLGQKQAAERCYRDALQLQPDLAPANYNLARLLLDAGQAEAAEPLLRTVTRAAPAMAEAWLVLGNALKTLARRDEAADAYAQATALKPDYAEAFFNRAVVVQELHRHDEAIADYGRFMQLRGEHPQALNQIGLCLRQQARYDEALPRFRRAVELDPNFAGAWTNLGLTLDDLGDEKTAVDAFDRALAIDPRLVQAMYGKAVLLDQQEAFDGARALYESILQIDPDLPYTRMRLLRLRMGICDWVDVMDDVRDMLRRIDDGRYSGFAFDALALPDANPVQHLRIAQTHAEHFAHIDRSGFTRHERRPGRLRIGYVSADFHEHATAYLAAGLFERHDRSQFEVFAYSMGIDDQSPMRQRLLDAFEHFTDIR
ncbi:MAG: tetratricopeptide repeat protein, partial [Chromatiales bacterium]|nr:tetratricopeptide repeat protein [Chromatiales bacterium]